MLAGCALLPVGALCVEGLDSPGRIYRIWGARWGDERYADRVRLWLRVHQYDRQMGLLVCLLPAPRSPVVL